MIATAMTIIFSHGNIVSPQILIIERDRAPGEMRQIQMGTTCPLPTDNRDRAPEDAANKYNLSSHR